VKEKGGEETYHAFLSPQAMARLKVDPTYMLNLRHAQPRADGNPLYTGSVVKIDGIYLHEFRHVPNTRLATSGQDMMGPGNDVDGCQILFCGAQALGMADIGSPEWNEKGFDYENQQGIATGKICGFLKPQFYTQYSGGTVQDHGVLSLFVDQSQQ
jgi:N4-gp56 family major capsid protein